MRLRRKKVAFNQKLVIDSIGAGIVVGLAPTLLNRFLFQSNPISGMTGTAAGVGVNYLLSQFMGRPDMANVGIGIGLVQFIEPLINELTGLGKPLQSLPVSTTPAMAGALQVANTDLSDYGRLDAYISSPSQMSYQNYNDSY